MNDQPTMPLGPQDSYFAQQGPLGPPPQGPPTAPAPQPAPRRGRRTGLAAAVVATALVAGGAAGVGGAAAWSSLDDEGSPFGGSSAAQTSQVVDTPDSPAADGSVEQVAAKVLPSVVKIDVSGAQAA